MVQIMKPELKYEQRFDGMTKRQYINNINVVMHCHHFSVLYTQLAIDAGMTDLLESSAREAFKEMLELYFQQNPTSQLEHKIHIGCQYFSMLGLGRMVVLYLGKNSCEIELLTSHVDQGWIKKWGSHDKPVNYISAGFIGALVEILLETSDSAFEVVETQSIVMGSKTSKFKVIRR